LALVSGTQYLDANLRFHKKRREFSIKRTVWF